MWTGSKNLRFRSRTQWGSANATHFWQEDFVPDELKKGGFIRTGSKNMGSRSRTQGGSSNMTNYFMMPKQTKYNVLHAILKPTYAVLPFCHNRQSSLL